MAKSRGAAFRLKFIGTALVGEHSAGAPWSSGPRPDREARAAASSAERVMYAARGSFRHAKNGKHTSGALTAEVEVIPRFGKYVSEQPERKISRPVFLLSQPPDGKVIQLIITLII